MMTKDHVLKTGARDHARGIERSRRSEAVPRDGAHTDDDHYRQPHRDRTGVVQPLANIEADHIQNSKYSQGDDRKNDVEICVVRQVIPPIPAHEQDVTCGEIEHSGEIRQITGPVNPGTNEAAEVAECTLGPDVKPAFLRITRGKLDHRKRQRSVEGEPRAEPDDHGAGAGTGGGRDPAQADAGDDVKQHQVQESNGAHRLQQWGAGASRRGNQWAFKRGTNSAGRIGCSHQIVYGASNASKKEARELPKCGSLVIPRYGILPRLLANETAIFQQLRW